MKQSLGKIWILFCFVLLNAEDFTYNLNVNKTTPYVKEAVILTLDVNQTNHDVVLLFDFDLVKKESYSYQRVDIKEINSAHNLQIRYTYLIYPLQEGDIEIDFKLKKRVTTDDSIAYSFSGDRDNVKGLVTKDFMIDLLPVKLHVKPLQKGVLLVGDFTLDYSIKKSQVKPYEALPFHFTIKGKGYPPLIKKILPEDINFTIFKEKPSIDTISNKDGTYSTVKYTMSLSHNKDFTLPALSFKAFNPLTKKSYTLHIPSHNFKVIETNKTELLDKVDNPPLLKEDWGWLKTLLTYFMIFISGYLTAKAVQWQKKSAKKESINPLKEKVRLATSKKELLRILMAHNNQELSAYIKVLEDSMYADGKMGLKEVKKEVLDLL
jgi:hypothetical protein